MIEHPPERVAPAVFEPAPSPPAAPLKSALSPSWETIRDSHPVQPFEVSTLSVSEAYRDEFRLGLEVLGHDDPKPQQMRIADVLNSTTEDGLPLYDQVAVQVSRRAGKSETTTAVALGRCLSRGGYLVAVMFCTTGTKAASRWRDDVFGALESWAGRVYGDKDAWPFVITYSNGRESVHFKNGSRILILPPKQSAFRSEAFDLIIADEAGEASAKDTRDLKRAVSPTMSTRPHAQLVVTGTPSEFRTGNWLWDALQDGRDEEEPSYGLVNYSAGRELVLEDIETWELASALTARVHPGVGNLTTLDKLRKEYKRLGALDYATEYLGWFKPDASSTGVFNPGKWEESETTEEMPSVAKLPTRVAFGVHARRGTSAIVAAWRDQGGCARLLLLKQEAGYDWLTDDLRRIVARFPKAPIAFDEKGEHLLAVEELAGKSPAPNFVKYNLATVPVAAALLVREVHTGRLKHYGQPTLTEAILSASKRPIGLDERTWAFGRLTDSISIVAVEAASIALREFDQMKAPLELPEFMRAS